MSEHFQLHWTRDAGWINSVLNHPAIYHQAAADATPPIGQVDISPVLDEVGVLVASQQGQPVGFFLLVQRPGHVLDCHAVLFPHCRGARGRAATLAAIDHLFIETPAAALTIGCPACIPEARVMARWCGFKPVKGEPLVFTRGGVNHPVTVMALTRDEWLHHSPLPEPVNEKEASCLGPL